MQERRYLQRLSSFSADFLILAQTTKNHEKPQVSSEKLSKKLHMVSQNVTQKIKIVLHKVKASDNYGYLYLRVKLPGKKKYKPKSLGYKVDEAFWDAKNQSILPGFADYDIINDAINLKKAAFKRELRSLEDEGKLTDTLIHERLHADKKLGSFIAFFRSHKDHLRKKHSEGYGKHWESQYNTLIEFTGEQFSFSEVTMEWLRDYETYLRTEKDLADTTLHTAFKRLKEVIDLAIEREHIKPSQIAGYKFPRYRSPERKYLTLEETDSIFSKLGDMDDTVKAVAAYFLVECYAGIRISDWKRFSVEKLISEDNFKVRTKKNKEPVYLPLKHFPRLAKVLDYIREHDLQYTITDQVANKYLKIVASHAKIKMHLTSHIGRHTCGTLLGELGWSTKMIAEVLGISEQTAGIYVKQTRRGLRTEAERFGGL